MESIMDLLDDSARGTGVIRFLPDESPVRIGALWDESTVASLAVASAAGTGGAIGALLTNTRAAVRGALAVWLSGNALVSLPQRAPRQDLRSWHEDIKRMCSLCGVEAVLTEDRRLGDLAGTGLVAMSFESLERGGVGPAPARGLGELVQFTSGSTSKPKGVALSGQALASNLLGIQSVIDMHEGDLGVSWLPLSHDMGLLGGLFTPIIAAARRFGCSGGILMSPGYFLRDPARWLAACAKFGGTTTLAPNFAFDLVTSVKSQHPPLDLSKLRTCITGAERIRPASLRSFANAFRGSAFNELSICPAYGMAENGLAVTMVRPEHIWRTATIDGGEVVSTGRPLPGVDIRVDIVGESSHEIQFRSLSLLDRYVGAEVPWTPDGWFRTRDCGQIIGEELFVLGRRDDTIDVGGRNVYPEDVESAAGDTGKRCLVAAIPWENRRLALVAETELRNSDLRAAAQEIVQAVSQKTGVVVSAFFFVRRGAIPRTSSGKLRRGELSKLLDTEGFDVVAQFGKTV